MLLRHLLSHRHTRWEKLLLIARILDLLERDYHATYPSDPLPLEDSYETTLREMLLHLK